MDDLEIDVEAVIEACDGNLLDTIRALLIANRMLENELREIRAATSRLPA